MKLKVILEDAFGEQYQIGQIEASYEDAFYTIMEGLNLNPTPTLTVEEESEPNEY